MTVQLNDKIVGASSTSGSGAVTDITGNAGTATKLLTARTIDGQSFDGSANITVMAPATHAATVKSVLADADEFGFYDSVAGVWKKITWAEFKNMTKPTTTEFIPNVGIVVNSGAPDISQGTTGPFTYIPENSIIYVDAVSGGGGGGGGHSSGGGGGGGANSGSHWKHGIHVISGLACTITLGAAGIGGAVGATGETGGASTLVQNGITLFYSGLGIGGTGATSSNGAAGGVSGTGVGAGAGGVSASGALAQTSPSRISNKVLGGSINQGGGGGGAVNYNGGQVPSIYPNNTAAAGGVGGASGGGGGGGANSLWGKGGTGGSNGVIGIAPDSSSYGAGGGGGSGASEGTNGAMGYLAITENI